MKALVLCSLNLFEMSMGATATCHDRLIRKTAAELHRFLKSPDGNGQPRYSDKFLLGKMNELVESNVFDGDAKLITSELDKQMKRLS